jgi:hypothetical protein
MDTFIIDLVNFSLLSPLVTAMVRNSLRWRDQIRYQLNVEIFTSIKRPDPSKSCTIVDAIFPIEYHREYTAVTKRLLSQRNHNTF